MSSQLATLVQCTFTFQLRHLSVSPHMQLVLASVQERHRNLVLAPNVRGGYYNPFGRVIAHTRVRARPFSYSITMPLIYWSLVLIIDCLHIFLLQIIDQSQDSDLSACKSSMSPCLLYHTVSYTSTWLHKSWFGQIQTYDSCKNSMRYEVTKQNNYYSRVHPSKSNYQSRLTGHIQYIAHA